MLDTKESELTIAVSVLIVDATSQIKDIVTQISSIETYCIDCISIVYCLQAESYEIFLSTKNIITQLRPDIRCFYAGQGGVAKSRNVAILSCCTKYLWFWDLDCRLTRHCSLLPIITKHNDVALFEIQTSRSAFRNAKKIFTSSSTCGILCLDQFYSKLSFAASAATYNILVDAPKIRNLNLFFDHNLGLGSKLLQSDEAMFILQYFVSKGNLFTKNSFVSISLNQSIGTSISHDARGVNLRNSIASKGYVLRRVFGYSSALIIAPLIAIIFYYKYHPHISLLQTYKSVLQGVSLAR